MLFYFVESFFMRRFVERLKMRNRILRQIREVSDEWGIEINDFTKIYGDLHFCELDSMELFFNLQKEFKIEIDVNKWDSCNTVLDIYKIIENEQ